MAAAPAVAAPVGVSRRGFAVLGPPAQDLIRAVVATATGHARRSFIDLKPKSVETEVELRRMKEGREVI